VRNALARLRRRGNVVRNIASGIVSKVPLPDGGLFISAGQIDWRLHAGQGLVLQPDRGQPANLAAFFAEFLGRTRPPAETGNGIGGAAGTPSR
jgi:hypothetical protein